MGGLFLEATHVIVQPYQLQATGQVGFFSSEGEGSTTGGESRKDTASGVAGQALLENPNSLLFTGALSCICSAFHHQHHNYCFGTEKKDPLQCTVVKVGKIQRSCQVGAGEGESYFNNLPSFFLFSCICSAFHHQHHNYCFGTEKKDPLHWW